MSDIPENRPPIVIVVAMSKPNRAIGHGNGLLWHLPEDLKHFKSLSMGHPVIMGQKTYESILEILGKPFPGRTSIVATLDPDYTTPYKDVKIVHSLPEAVTVAMEEEPTEIHIGGGGEIYRQMLPYTDRLHITWVDDDPEADTFFPEFESEFEAITEHDPREHNGISYQWIDYVKKRS